jgi:hypothetical protein
LWGAATHLEAARQYGGGGVDACLDALLHHRPDLEQPAANVIFCMPGHFVGHHDVADAQSGFCGVDQQFIAGAKRIAHGGRVCDDDGVVIVGDLRVVEDESPSDGIERSLRHHRVVVAVCAKHHRVGVKPRFLGGVQDDVVGEAERDRMFVEQRQLIGSVDGGDALGRAVGVDGVRPLPHQAKRDGGNAAVPLTRRAK